MNPERCLAVYDEVGVAGADVPGFRVAEARARADLAREITEGSRGTEAELWGAYFRRIFEGTGVPDDLLDSVGQRLRAAHRERHLWDWVDGDTPGALQTLLDRGYRLAVVSNADGRVEALLEDRGLTDYFEFVLDSHVVGVEKPDPRIFRSALDRLGVEPARALYVGDLYPVDVLGARRAGMRAALLDPFDVLSRHDDVDRIRSVAELPGYLEALARPA